QFVPVLQVHAAVAACLTSSLGHERGAELDVELKVLKVVLGARTRQKQVVFDDLAANPSVGVGSIEEHTGALGWLGPQGRTLALDLRQRTDRRAVGIGDHHLAVDDPGAAVVAAEGNGPLFGAAVDAELAIAPVPARAWQAPKEELAAELAVAQR